MLFEKLTQEKIDFRLTVTLSPTLVSMLTDPLLQGRYLRHINKLIELARRERQRLVNQPEFKGLAEMYLNEFLAARDIFCRYNHNLANAFKNFSGPGKVEIITCGATHGFFR